MMARKNVQEDNTDLYITEERTFETSYYVVHALVNLFDPPYVGYVVEEGVRSAATATLHHTIG